MCTFLLTRILCIRLAIREEIAVTWWVAMQLAVLRIEVDVGVVATVAVAVRWILIVVL